MKKTIILLLILAICLAPAQGVPGAANAEAAISTEMEGEAALADLLGDAGPVTEEDMTPTQETVLPAEIPFESAPAEEATAEPQPESAPAEEATAEPQPESAPAEEAPAEPQPESAPAEEAPAEPQPESAPAEEATAELQPESAPAEEAPAEPQPESAPAEEAPAELQPESAPAEEVPAETQPESALAGEAPAENQPEPVPAEEVAIEAQQEPAFVEQATVETVVEPALVEQAPLESSVEAATDAQVLAPGGEPTDLALNATTLVLGQKESFAMAATPLPDGSASTITWRSDNAKVIRVDAATGMLTASKKGRAIIYATTANGIERSCQVTVMKAPKKLAVSPEKLYLSAGGQVGQLSVTLTKKTGCHLYFETSDPNVAVVDAAGVVTTVNPGVATVTVRTFNGKSASCEVHSLDPSIPMPAAVQLAAPSVTIGVKQSFALNPTFLAADGTPIAGVDYSVSTSAKKKLTVGANGVVTGVKAGKYTATVTAYNGVSASCEIVVAKPPSKVAVEPVKGTIGPGQTRQLTVTFPKGGVGTYSFASSAPDVVAVDANGNVTGVSLGTAVITVRTSNGKTARSTITVERGPEYMALNADYQLQFDPLNNAYSTLYAVTLNPGESYQLFAENEYMTYGDVTGYESSDSGIAVVSATGLITAVAAGTANIAVRSTSGAQTYCRVTVNGKLPASISFIAGDASVAAGRSVPLPGIKGVNIGAAELAAATYASTDEGVVTVTWSEADAEWKLNGVNPGSAVIVATAGGATAQLPVSVTGAVASAELRFVSSRAMMNVGDSWKPVVTDEYGATVDAALSSDNPDVVRVDEARSLIAASEGDAVVTAVWNGLAAKLDVSVRPGAATLTLSPTELTLHVRQRATLTAQVNGEAAANLSFASSDPAVASVNQSGTVIARATGTAVVTVTAYGGAAASCTVHVAPSPSHISLEPGSVTGRLDEGGAQLAWTFGAPDEAGNVSFASSDPQIASVNEAGYVAFVAAGRAVVTATADSGVTASVDVTVLPAKPVSATPTYRLFAAYSYANSAYKGFLPFPDNNAKSLAAVFENSSVSGLGYTTRVLGNPSKTQLLSGISSFFATSADVDVSIVYLCSHGHMTNGYGGYRLSLPGYDDNTANANYYITAQEIFNCVSRINGSVVLILDSCYSGAFLQDMQAQLDAMGGRIAVLTAASDTRASYYKVKKNKKSVDFFTFFLLKGLGYNHRQGWWNSNAKGSRGAYPGFLAADATGNGDGIVTLGEAYAYAANSIAANIPGYMKKSWYWGDATRVQEPRFYAGSLNDLVIYKPR